MTRSLVLLLFSMVGVIGSAPGHAADGSLDPTFGSGGRVTTSFAVPGVPSGARAVVVQPDGRIVVAGHVGWQDLSAGSFALARYNPNGSLDQTFGGSGKVVTAVTSGGHAQGLLRQPDGKLLAVGSSSFPGRTFMLIRYETDGSLDESFGTGGMVSTDLGSGTAYDAVLIPGGKILVAGGVSNSAGLTYDAALARYDSEGTLDTSFGSGGTVLADFGYGEFFVDLELAPDGATFYVTGEWYRPGPGRYGYDTDFFVARYALDGTLDTSFGTGGIVSTDFGTEYSDFEFGTALAIQPDGKILVAGPVGNFAGLARYAADGNPDPTFGQGGRVLLTEFLPQMYPSGLELEPDGKIVVAGTASRGPDGVPFGFAGGPHEFALTRLNSDGNFDPTFAPCPQVTTSFAGSGATGWALARQPDGKYLLAGETLGSESKLALARYGTSSSPACQAAMTKRSSVVIRDDPNHDRDVFSWLWVSSGTVSLADFGDPTTDVGYTLCVLEDTGGSPRLELGGPVICTDWKVTATGYRFKRKGESESPISQVTLRSGGAGKAKIQVKAKGEYLAPDLPLSTPVTVRLVRDNAPMCWEATFGANLKVNDGKRFVAKSD